MTPHSALIAIGWAVLAPLACQAPQSVDESPSAALLQTCAPWDGPAVSLFLTDSPGASTYPAPPYRAITIYRDLNEVLGERFEVTATTPQVGIAQDCASAGRCAPVLGAAVQFGGLGADSTILVTYRFQRAAGRVQSGIVKARLYPQARMCG
ncbi:MAG TPA: hypothetical protein VIP80_11155 [Gemmatimonadales bacterium]